MYDCNYGRTVARVSEASKVQLLTELIVHVRVVSVYVVEKVLVLERENQLCHLWIWLICRASSKALAVYIRNGYSVMDTEQEILLSYLSTEQ